MFRRLLSRRVHPRGHHQHDPDHDGTSCEAVSTQGNYWRGMIFQSWGPSSYIYSSTPLLTYLYYPNTLSSYLYCSTTLLSHLYYSTYHSIISPILFYHSLILPIRLYSIYVLRVQMVTYYWLNLLVQWNYGPTFLLWSDRLYNGKTHSLFNGLSERPWALATPIKVTRVWVSEWVSGTKKLHLSQKKF